jgi:hypothetical protein
MRSAVPGQDGPERPVRSDAVQGCQANRGLSPTAASTAAFGAFCAYANRSQAIFQAIYDLLSAGEMDGVVVPPKLSAAMYRVLQQLPGVHFESATDLAGRQGLGFYMVLEGYLKLELVIDPDTYTYMGFKDVAIRDHAMTDTAGTRYVKKGHVMGWAALLGQAIVEKPGQLPS